MATESNEAFFRNYFAGYEMERLKESISVKLEHDLEDCHCVLNCCFRMLPEVRLQLRAWYQRLTTLGRKGFLSAHMRESSPGQNQYCLPTVGGLERVCAVHFINTLQETKDRVRSVMLEKRMAFLPEEEADKSMECEEGREEDCLVDLRCKKGAKKADLLDRIARGLSYRMNGSKRVVPARKVKAPCNSSCRYKCYERFTLAERQQKLKELLQMSLDKQREFLADHVCKMTPFRRRSLSTSSRFGIFYCFREGRQLHRVCKTMYLNTYDITDRRLRGLMEEKGANAHEICGNPMLINILKKYQYRRMVYDVDEGLDKEADERRFKEFMEGTGCVDMEETPFEEEFDEVSIDYSTIKEELNEAEQKNDGTTQLHSNSVPTQSTDQIDPLGDGDGAPSTGWIKQENKVVGETLSQNINLSEVKLKTETVNSETNDLSDNVSNYEPNPVEDDFPSDSATSQRGKRWVVKPHCGSKCIMQCYTRVSDELRRQLLADLLQLPPAEQQKFLGDHICVMPSVRTLSKSSRRRFTNHYFFPVGSRLVKVCKQMFSSTYDMPDSLMRRIILEKGDCKHVVCGNPNFPSVLKRAAGHYFDYNEGLEKVSKETCQCNLQCPSKFSKEAIEELRSNFHRKSTDEQNNILLKYVQLSAGDKSLLVKTQFFLPLQSTLEEVCQKMFLSTFKVSWSSVRVLLNELDTTAESLEFAKAHIVSCRTDEDHHCKVGGGVRKLSCCPNVTRMYNLYRKGLDGDHRQELKAISYQRYFDEFSQHFSRTGLMLPARCPDCGFYSKGSDGLS